VNYPIGSYDITVSDFSRQANCPVSKDARLKL